MVTRNPKPPVLAPEPNPALRSPSFQLSQPAEFDSGFRVGFGMFRVQGLGFRVGSGHLGAETTKPH